MNLRKILFCFVYLLISSTVHSQITFERMYGGSDDEYCDKVIQTNDGGYAIIGSTKSLGAGDFDVYLIKTNSYGDTLWTHTYGGAGVDFGYGILQTGDGGYLINGSTSSIGSGQDDVYLIKTDEDGNPEWTRTYGGSGRDFGYYITQLNSGGWVICGATNSFGAGESDIYLIKINEYGDTIWTKTYGGSYWDVGGPIIQTDDDGLLFAGQNTYIDLGWHNIELFKTDSNGVLLWTRYYSNGQWNNPRSLIKTIDGGYLIAGCFYTDTYYPYLIKINASGDTAWTQKMYWTNFGMAYSVSQGNDGNYFVTGYMPSNMIAGTDTDIFLMKINSAGDTIWTRTYGNDFNTSEGVHFRTSDGGIIIAGRQETSYMGENDILLIKTDENGIMSINESVAIGKTVVLISPNPTANHIILQLPPNFDRAKKTEICDHTGRQIMTMDYSAEMDVCSLSGGLYYIVVTNSEGEWVSGTFIRE